MHPGRSARRVGRPTCLRPRPTDARWQRPDSDSVHGSAPWTCALPLAAAGCEVLVPVLIDRKDTWSGTERFSYTNQTHREFLYRMAFEVGRHIIGFEGQQVLAAVDWFASRERDLPVGVIGYGEGGLIALYAGAADERIDAVAVTGYFGKREGLWQEPIYRNVCGVLREFDDGMLARMIAPRALVVEASRAPEVAVPPAPAEKRRNAAENRLVLRGDGTGSPGLAANEFLQALRPDTGRPDAARADSHREFAPDAYRQKPGIRLHAPGAAVRGGADAPVPACRRCRCRLRPCPRCRNGRTDADVRPILRTKRRCDGPVRLHLVDHHCPVTPRPGGMLSLGKAILRMNE